MEELRNQANTDFADNSSGQISAADLRNFCVDMVDTMSPGYAVLGLSTSADEDVPATPPVVITAFDTAVLDTEPFTLNLGAGTITSQANVTADLSVDVTCSFAGARQLKLQLYRNGASTPYAAERDGEGASSPVIMSLGGVIEANIGDVFDLRGNMDQTTSTTVQFTELVFTARAIPRRTAT